MEPAGRDRAESAPLERVGGGEHLVDERLRLEVSIPCDRPRILVLDLAATFVELTNEHQDSVEYVQRLEPADRHG